MPTTYLVTRHPGALDWAQQNDIRYDQHLPYLDPALIQPGDCVIGSLPVHLAAQVCARQGRYFNLSLDLPAHLRGKELDATTLAIHQARLEEFHIQQKL